MLAVRVSVYNEPRPHQINNGTRPAPNLDVQKLIARTLGGDQVAFGDLYELHKRRVFSLCLRMTRSSSDAEDLTQETFLQVFRKLHTFRGESSFSTWLHRIAANTVLMRLRKVTPVELPLDGFESDEEQASIPEIGIEDISLAGGIDRITLCRAIDQLPPGYRIVFLLHDVHGYEHKEIASIMCSTTGNSKSQLHKARIRLRELLTSGARQARGRSRASSASGFGRRDRERLS